MASYPPFTEVPHLIPMSGVSGPTCDAFDPSLPTDYPFVTRASQFQFQLSSPYDPTKAHDAGPTSWGKGEADPSWVAMGYMAPGFPAYADHFSPWNSGVSTVSDPQSPRSSNCIRSPSYFHDELPMPVDEQAGYPTPDSRFGIDHSLSQSRGFEVQPDPRSSLEADFDPWSGSQSDHNGTPEQQWSSPLPADAMAFPQSLRRSPVHPASSTRVRKPAERRPTSTSGRSRRRRGVTSPSHGDGSHRFFVCSFAPYGCESTFVSKNEWKRHVTSQHLQLGFYRCDVGKCSVHSHPHPCRPGLTPSSTSPTSRPSTPPPGQPNDFNRKDLFTQHQRRMHVPWLHSGRRRTPTDAEHAAFEADLEDVRRRCWHRLRTMPQQSHCGFCREAFSGEGSWDVRMEHVGRHFEREDRQALGEEVEDVALREWGLREGILTLADAGRCRLASLVEVDS
ncbi:uncharacterized protein N7482_008968 [Penicillium canariense]|uniref:C2H2 finger domain protein n=1 Tax=Penicillium canariense TaxID=189055 RepID=A0A9W9HUA9_9EURO|nr:uncharacterized protein N7482_008968 [Penicillium canariense]KAJ5157868.1 hypothetical protein N7482_008968 [Penicillium canariense]